METLLFTTCMAPNMTPVYGGIVEAVGAALGRRAELVDDQGVGQLWEGPVDAAFICGLPYVRRLAERPASLTVLVAPLLAGSRYGDRPVYFSDVIVRHDSRYQSLADLRGARWAHNADDSFSGYLITRYELHRRGQDEGFFGRVTYSGGHLVSIQQVLAGEVDGSAIDSHVLGMERQRDPDLDRRLRIVATFGPSPNPPVVSGPRVSPEVARRLRRAFCALADDPRGRALLAKALIRRYVAVDDADYEDIRRKLAAVERSSRNPTTAAAS